jgi:hypothetical protein
VSPTTPAGEVPRFAVVGRVNKGKSSIVATLAEDDSVRIDPRPGTTTEVREYPVRVDGRTLFVLLDTPGFEDAPRALAWLRARETSAAERPERVAELVRAFEGTDELAEERRLLAPILAGAAVLYVVDGAHPYRPNYEAEMEILRWTGRPRMALVNRIGARDHAAEWRRALGQFFVVVRDFDAFSASFEERVHLLRVFREIEPSWRGAVDEAVSALVAQRRRRRNEAAAMVADLLVDALTHHQEVEVEDALAAQAEITARREALERSFHEALRKVEVKSRRGVEGVFHHREVHFVEAGLARPVFDEDLFAEAAWRLLGLSPAQLVAAGALAGAAVGGAIDASVGGASFLAGTVAGGLVGGGSALYGVGRRFARARSVAPPGVPALLAGARRFFSSARQFRIGPHAQPNFPWVLLDRALLHYDAVARHTHARRGAIALEGGGTRAGIVTGFARQERAEIEKLFRRLRRAFRDPPRDLRDGLECAIARVLARIDPVEGR